ncbi:MAG: response regulator [Solirubrobacteraceae bacterium]|jgi:CheY-like chemotaxis protein
MSPDLLVVDDDPFIRRLITTTLEDVAEFRLLEAEDGDQALALADRQRPQIVLLDVDIPGVDGIEVCRALRANPRTSEATIVMLTASHNEEIEARAETAGADLFLTKPFSPLELLRLVDGLSGQGDADPG